MTVHELEIAGNHVDTLPGRHRHDEPTRGT